jgi:uncharacterized protein
MIIDINRDTIAEIKNPALAAYAGIYVGIYEQFMAQFEGSGIEIDPACYQQQVDDKTAVLRQKGAIFRNQDKSIYVNQISPACVACQTGVGSATFFVSLKCHRDCYYCFNPNQEHYDHFTHHQRDLVAELAQVKAAGQKIKHLALTGGEPLLHKEEAVAFYRYASDNFPEAFNRLYTCGDYADEAILAELQAAGLDEIRFSIRMHDLAKGHRFVFDRIALAKQYIPHVMVEMPILPGTLEIMQDVLLELDQIGIDSINLLEFCFPLINAEQFRERGFKLKQRPYKILYNYWYAGGLPIARSELECLDLLAFALDQAVDDGRPLLLPGKQAHRPGLPAKYRPRHSPYPPLLRKGLFPQIGQSVRGGYTQGAQGAAPQRGQSLHHERRIRLPGISRRGYQAAGPAECRSGHLIQPL